jgi:hypothetical protein
LAFLGLEVYVGSFGEQHLDDIKTPIPSRARKGRKPFIIETFALRLDSPTD